MKFDKPTVEVIPCPSAIVEDGHALLAHIERCGRIAYRSENKIGEGTAIPFIHKIIESGHTSVLEHSEICLMMSDEVGRDLFDTTRILMEADGFQSYLTVLKIVDGYMAYGNVRAWMDLVKAAAVRKVVPGAITAQLMNTQPHIFMPEFLGVPDITARVNAEGVTVHTPVSTDPQKRVTVIIQCDRGVSHELVRHRVMSFTQESTRWCNYGHSRFGKGLVFESPEDCAYVPWEPMANVSFAKVCSIGETEYLSMINAGVMPQIARAALPNALQTRLAMTGTVHQWRAFFKLRTAADAHPQMREIARKIKVNFYEADIFSSQEAFS